jgi:hypothetical protein
MFVLLYIYNSKSNHTINHFIPNNSISHFPPPQTISQTTSAKLAARVGCNSRREKAFGDEKQRDGIGHCVVVFRRRV